MNMVDSKIIEELKKVKKISITTDLYTCSTHDHFIVLTGHFFDPNDFKLKSKTIRCRDLSGVVHVTAEELSKIIKII